jgi:hypothetical protein
MSGLCVPGRGGWIRKRAQIVKTVKRYVLDKGQYYSFNFTDETGVFVWTLERGSFMRKEGMLERNV